ncbi:hypothetical protein OQA88_7166 [Cercophora sp. LCS_1]
MGQKQSLPEPQSHFFCPQTGESVDHPLGVCEQCQAAHDIIWQAVEVCPNTGYRLEATRARRPHKECPSCFQAHRQYTKRVYICPTTGAQIPHPKETGGRCQKCNRSHEDNSTPMASRETVGPRISVRGD